MSSFQGVKIKVPLYLGISIENLFMTVPSYSAINSCPVSPSSDFRYHVPSFDLKAMAKYASKLLSTQQQQKQELQSRMDTTEVSIFFVIADFQPAICTCRTSIYFINIYLFIYLFILFPGF